MSGDAFLPEVVARCLVPTAALGLRLDAARGAIPLPPSQRLFSLAVLLADPAESVRAEARSALQGLPEAFVDQALKDPSLSGMALDAVVELSEHRPELLWRALEHPGLGPRTVERLLDTTDEEALSRLAQNQRVLDQNPELGRRLLDSPNLHPGDRSRLASLYGEPEVEAPLPDLEDVKLPATLPQELLVDAPGDKPSDGSQNLYQLIQSLSVAEKIKLATLGSKSARRLLVRDTNKIVAVSVIRSPKIREDEVVAIAQERTVPDEVIRIILTRKDWLKIYPLRVALCQNPKTPIPRALRLLETLQERELRQISKSRNVPGAVSTGAVRVLSRRGKV